MRTTLDLDEAVLAAGRGLVAEARARHERLSMGGAISLLTLQGMHAMPPMTPPLSPNGFTVFASDDPHHVITSEMVRANQDD